MSDAVRDAIVAALQGVPAIGRVHDRERYAVNKAALREIYGWNNPDTGALEIRGWHVRIEAERYGVPRAGRSTVATDWLIRGLLGFDDANASERLAAGLARTVVAAIGADATLGGTVRRLSDGAAGPDAPVGAQIARIEPVMFADALCHRVTLTLTTECFQ